MENEQKPCPFPRPITTVKTKMASVELVSNVQGAIDALEHQIETPPFDVVPPMELMVADPLGNENASVMPQDELSSIPVEVPVGKGKKKETKKKPRKKMDEKTKEPKNKDKKTKQTKDKDKKTKQTKKKGNKSAEIKKLPAKTLKAKTYDCDQCPRTFTESWNRDRHVRQQHGYELNGKQVVDRFVCPVRNWQQPPMLTAFNFETHVSRNHGSMKNLKPKNLNCFIDYFQSFCPGQKSYI